MVFPQSNTIYTFHEIINILQLSDSPFLQFVYNDTECIIQTSHVSDESLLNIPGMKESLWCFEKTTREAIPLFWYSDYNSDILKFVDIIDLGNERYLATPIGHPR
jgi:hypothetical protein